jgi:hypothetical protein
MSRNRSEDLTKELEDKELVAYVRQKAAKQIKFLLESHDSMLIESELALKHSIIRAIAPNLFPKLAENTDIPVEETKLTAEEQEHLNKILDD